jgi:hypothetical protein
MPFAALSLLITLSASCLDLRLQAVRDVPRRTLRHVQVDQRCPRAGWPSGPSARANVAPFSAASVLPVCRRSWKWTAGPKPALPSPAGHTVRPRERAANGDQT